MARITLAEVKAWAEPTKVNVETLDLDLLAHIEEEVLSRVSAAYDTSTWLNATSTPKLVRTTISKLYLAWVYDRQYSEDVEGGNAYAVRLAQNAEMLLTGLIDGTIILPGITTEAGLPAFYPTDVSSNAEPTVDNTSLGPAKFSMGTVF